MHICLLYSYKCNAIWNAFLRDAIWLCSHNNRKKYLNEKTAGNIQLACLHAAKWTFYNYHLCPILHDQRTTLITPRGAGCGYWGLSWYRQCNIISQNLAAAQLLLRLILSYLELEEKRWHADHDCRRTVWAIFFLKHWMKRRSARRPLYPVSAYNDMSDVCGQAEDGVERHLVRCCQSHTGKPK